MLHLLKEKSKIQWKPKERKRYQPLTPKIKVQQEPMMRLGENLNKLAQNISSSIANARDENMGPPDQIQTNKSRK